MTFRTRLPRKQGARECVLFRVYRTMRCRATGTGGTATPWIYPLGFPWKSYAEFRAWALASGFCKARPSPDRPRPTEPYGPTNVRWRTKEQNSATARGRNYYANAGAQPRGPEPPVDDHVPF